MSAVRESIVINAPPQVVFDTVMDADRLAAWVTIHRSVRVTTPPPLGAGTRMDQVLHIRGVSFTVHWTLEAMTPPSLAEWQGRGPAGSRALIRYKVSGDTDGPSVFEYTNEFSTPGGPLANVASRLVVGHASEHEARASLAKLKALLEK